MRQRLAGQHAQAGRLAGAVAPDQADAVTRLDPQSRRIEQDARASTQLELGCGDHGGTAPSR